MRRRGWLNVGKVMLCMCMVTTFCSMFYNQELAHGVPDDIAQELGLPSVNLKVSRWQAPPEKSGEQGQNEENGAHERLVYNKNEWSKDFPREGGPNIALEPPAIGELTVVRGDALIEENNNRNVPNIAVEPSHMRPPVRNDTMEDPKGDDGNLTYSHGRNTRQKISQRATDDTSTVSNASCPTPRTPPRYSKDQVPRDTWQVAEPGISQVFSAYADYRGTLAMIKLIGIRLLKVEKIPSPLKCRVWLKDASEPFLVKAKLSALPEIGKYLYKPMRFTCPLLKGQVPYAVSLVQDTCKEAENVVYVHNGEPEQERADRNFTICVPTMYGNYDNVAELVEMVEVNSMFGADRIVLYNYSTGANIQPYLRSYVQEGMVDIVKWDIPDKLANNVHNRGLMTVISDCVYRYMYRSRFLIVADLDEIIIPRKHSNWLEMMQSYLKNDSDSHSIEGALTFRCTFFRKEMINEEMAKNATIRDLGARTLLNTKREVKMWPHNSRTKYIVPPQAVDVPGVHYIHTFSYSSVKLKNIDVPVDLAFMHHYRLWQDPPGGPPPVLEDTFMLKYREDIVRRMTARHEKVKKNESLGYV